MWVETLRRRLYAELEADQLAGTPSSVKVDSNGLRYLLIRLTELLGRVPPARTITLSTLQPFFWRERLPKAMQILTAPGQAINSCFGYPAPGSISREACLLLADIEILSTVAPPLADGSHAAA